MGLVCIWVKNLSKDMELEREENEESNEKCVEDCWFAISNSVMWTFMMWVKVRGKHTKF